MIATIQLNTGNQLTLPAEICQQLNFQIGTRFTIFAEKDVLMLKPIQDLNTIAQNLQQQAQIQNITQDDINEVIQKVKKSS